MTQTEHIVITKENERKPHLMVEAIFMGFHIRYVSAQLEIVSEHTEEDEEFIFWLLGGANDFPFNNYDNISKNLVALIQKKDPDSKIIQANSFEYAVGVYPMQF